MKHLKKELEAITEELKALTRKTDRMIKQVEKLDKGQAAKRPETRAKKEIIVRKGKKISATDTVLAIIKKSRRSIDNATLINKTGFRDNNVRAILSRLTKQGKIKKVGKGMYVKA